MQVVQNDYVSDEIEADSGVQQGDKLSPLLFSIYIADLAKILEDAGCDVIFYADDLVIGARVIDKIHDAMDALSLYCDQNSLEVNTDKTKFMKFRHGGRLGYAERVKYNNEDIEAVNEFTYLGIILSSTLSINPHLKFLSLKCTKATNSLRAKVNYDKIKFQSAYKLLEAVIKPVATYGVSVFASAGTQNTIETHYRGIIGRYWKRWAKISKYCSNKDLVNHLYNDDFLDIQNTNTRNRRPFAMFYSNGLHHLMCDTENCYRPQQPSMCVCKFCYQPIFGKFHLFTCTASRHGSEHEKILQLYSTANT